MFSENGWRGQKETSHDANPFSPITRKQHRTNSFNPDMKNDCLIFL